MKKSLLFLLVSFSISAQLLSQQWVDKKFQYDSLLNITYGTAINFNGQIDTLKMDIYLPVCENQSSRTNRPLLLWIHGGAFLAGNKEDQSIQTLCKSFARRGYVTASIDYRLGFVADDLAWQCNYPNYSCVFAADSVEWARAYYRAVQDGKGALRYLINRHQEFNIDTNNVFIAGESAGSMTALGVGLMDTAPERPNHTYAMANVPRPNSITNNCIYNQGINFNGNSISRPDLGGIDGNIEPSTIKFKIKGIGNMYGSMLTDLLKNIPSDKPKPAIYSFHQPCDIIVSIDSNFVYWGLTWCFTNGYNCAGIANNKVMLYGSRVFSKWNKNNNYGYDIHDEFTNVSFPYSFLFGQGSCADQINNPCHGYDNKNRRENELATFFASKVTSLPFCDNSTTNTINPNAKSIAIYPNPVRSEVTISVPNSIELYIVDVFGKLVMKQKLTKGENHVDVSNLSSGLYIFSFPNGQKYKVLKE